MNEPTQKNIKEQVYVIWFNLFHFKILSFFWKILLDNKKTEVFSKDFNLNGFATVVIGSTF